MSLSPSKAHHPPPSPSNFHSPLRVAAPPLDGAGCCWPAGYGGARGGAAGIGVGFGFGRGGASGPSDDDWGVTSPISAAVKRSAPFSPVASSRSCPDFQLLLDAAEAAKAGSAVTAAVAGAGAAGPGGEVGGDADAAAPGVDGAWRTRVANDFRVARRQRVHSPLAASFGGHGGSSGGGNVWADIGSSFGAGLADAVESDGAAAGGVAAAATGWSFADAGRPPLSPAQPWPEHRLSLPTLLSPGMVPPPLSLGSPRTPQRRVPSPSGSGTAAAPSTPGETAATTANGGSMSFGIAGSGDGGGGGGGGGCAYESPGAALSITLPYRTAEFSSVGVLGGSFGTHAGVFGSSRRRCFGEAPATAAAHDDGSPLGPSPRLPPTPVSPAHVISTTQPASFSSAAAAGPAAGAAATMAAISMERGLGAAQDGVSGSFLRLWGGVQWDARVEAAAAAAAAGLAQGRAPRLAEDSVGGTYYLSDASGRRVAVFKPADEEAYGPNNPHQYCGSSGSGGGSGNCGGSGGCGKAGGDSGSGVCSPAPAFLSGGSGGGSSTATIKSGVRSGGGALRECAAFLLDDGFAGVPPTAMVIADHAACHHGGGAGGGGGDRVMEDDSGAGGKTSDGGGGSGSGGSGEHGGKVGSLQVFVPNECTAEDLGPSLFPTEDVHRIAILDVRLCNMDRHVGNILVQRPPRASPVPSAAAAMEEDGVVAHAMTAAAATAVEATAAPAHARRLRNSSPAQGVAHARSISAPSGGDWDDCGGSGGTVGGGGGGSGWNAVATPAAGLTLPPAEGGGGMDVDDDDAGVVPDRGSNRRDTESAMCDDGDSDDNSGGGGKVVRRTVPLAAAAAAAAAAVKTPTEGTTAAAVAAAPSFQHWPEAARTERTSGSYGRAWRRRHARPPPPLRLVPIDHGLCLPHVLRLSDAEFAWRNWPAAREPLSDACRRYVNSLDADADIARLRARLGDCLAGVGGGGAGGIGGIGGRGCGSVSGTGIADEAVAAASAAAMVLPEECLLSLRVGTALLKRGVAAGLTLCDIGTAMTREHPDSPCLLEEAVAAAAAAVRDPAAAEGGGGGGDSSTGGGFGGGSTAEGGGFGGGGDDRENIADPAAFMAAIEPLLDRVVAVQRDRSAGKAAGLGRTLRSQST